MVTIAYYYFSKAYFLGCGFYFLGYKTGTYYIKGSKLLPLLNYQAMATLAQVFVVTHIYI
jgi:hypothetical protein